MSNTVFSYPLTIKKDYLDAFGHVNNAAYLTLYEEARWDIVNKNRYGLDKMIETGLAPTILEIKLSFLKELRLDDEIIIQTQLLSYQKKVGIFHHQILRDNVVCSRADFTIGLFDLKTRKLVAPTPEWLQAIGA